MAHHLSQVEESDPSSVPVTWDPPAASAIEKQTQPVVARYTSSVLAHVTSPERRKATGAGSIFWGARISCSALLAAILFLCAWVAIARPLAVPKDISPYSDAPAAMSWVSPSILVVTTLLTMVVKSQLEVALSSLAEGITVRGEGLPFRMAAVLAGYPAEGLSSVFHPGGTKDSTLGEQGVKSVILNRKFISVMGVSIYLTGLLVAAITYILQPVVDPSAIVSYAGISTACGFNLSMEDLIRAGPGCGTTSNRSRLTGLRTAECLLGTAAEITGPFAAGEGTSLVRSGLMRLRGSGLTASYGVCQSTYGNSPGNRSVRFGNAAAAYPDRAWLESLVTLPGECQANAMGKTCGWELTGLGAPRLEARGNVPIYVARVQCVRSTHFTKLYLPQRNAAPVRKLTPNFPIAIPPLPTLVAQALSSGDVAFRGPLAGVHPVFGSEPPFNEIVPELKGESSRVTFAVLPAGIIPNSRSVALENGGGLVLADDDFRLNVSFVCGASVYATEQHLILGSDSVSIQLPDIEFSEDEYPVNLDLSNMTLTHNAASGDRVPGLNESNIGQRDWVTVERGGILAALNSTLGRIWEEPGAKAIAGPLYIKYGEEGVTSNQSLWLSESVTEESFATPYAGAEKEVAQVMADALRLLCLGLSKPAWLKSVGSSVSQMEFNSTVRQLLQQGGQGSNEINTAHCTALVPSSRTIGALRLGGISSIRYVAFLVVAFHGLLQMILVVLLFMGYLPKPHRGTFYETLALGVYSGSRRSGEGPISPGTPALGFSFESLYKRQISVVEEGGEEFMRL